MSQKYQLKTETSQNSPLFLRLRVNVSPSAATRSTVLTEIARHDAPLVWKSAPTRSDQHWQPRVNTRFKPPCLIGHRFEQLVTLSLGITDAFLKARRADSPGPETRVDAPSWRGTDRLVNERHRRDAQIGCAIIRVITHGVDASTAAAAVRAQCSQYAALFAPRCS